MTVLSTVVTELTVKAALGVLVGLAVLVGLGVLEGGMRETSVSVGRGVKVGRNVFVAVTTMVGLGVHVGSNWMGVGVRVGRLGPNIPLPPGGKGFKEEPGLMNTSAKYPIRQTVMTSIRIERISHICMGRLDRFPLKS